MAFNSEVDDVTKGDMLEHFLFMFVGIAMVTLYDLSVGVVLIAMSMMNLLLTGKAYAQQDNEAFGLIVPGNGDSLSEIVTSSSIGIVLGGMLSVILGLAIGSTEFLVPILGAGQVNVVGGPVMTSILLFLAVVIAYPRAEESLWQTFGFTMKEKLEDNFPLFITSILLMSFAFGFFHIITATTILQSFGVPLSQSLLNVVILRMAVTIGAFMYSLSFAKSMHSGFNLVGFIAVIGRIF